MRGGIIGAGQVGQALARRAVLAGHDVTLANSRAPETIYDLAATIGCAAARAEDVPALSELVVLAIPFTAVFGLAPELLAGRTVVDANNYYPDRDGRIAALDSRSTTTSEMVARHFPAAAIAKAFNAILARDLRAPPVLPGGARRALPIAGDDEGACAQVAALHGSLGYAAVDAGPLAEGWRFERAKPAYCVPLDRAGLVAALDAAERDVDRPEGSWR
ncbi:NAD(P)-binding domain-containing protein [Sphingomonas sp. RHCKR7]|uniref:NADPH-dependent F420 reductase n=1 Tax=Sphingomonas folli TaxID=2862497 RepID=UPI001CA5D73C|nr:NAD(P)-binding domain-containing protein [Sphingomonas folli]